MANKLISFEVSEKNGWTVWAVVGSMDIVTSPDAAEKGNQVLANATQMVADISRLEYLSSAGLRVLLRLAKQAKKEGKDFALAAPTQGMVATLLRECHMDMLVRVIKSLDEL